MSGPLRNVPVMGSDTAHLYAGAGDGCVLLCESGDIPRWRNALFLTPDAARSLAAQLTYLADLAETITEGDPR